MVARLPVGVSRGLGRCLGFLLSLEPRRRRVALDNLAKAFPGKDAAKLARAMYRHLGLMFVEMARSLGGRPPPVTFEGLEHLERALDKGRGAIVLTGHVGNFELLMGMAGRVGTPVHVIIRPFTSPVAAAILERLRAGGPNILAARNSGREALRILGRGEVIVFVLDQHVATRRAAWVPFFGRPAATSRDAVRLSHHTGAPIVPVFTWRRSDDHLAVFSPALELGEPTEAGIAEDTAKCAGLVEAAIRQEPAQWFWLHRRWRKPPATTPTQSREFNG